MNIISIIENIPPAFYGVLIGSLLTIIGVVLTNMSNTKRLRIQHEHERKIRSKERDLNMRREVYMDAMEAISTGITAISRFSELSETPEALMQSYTDLSPKVSKVTIVGQNETIEALSSFNLELNAAFLRMSAKRERFDKKNNESKLLENQIEAKKAKLNRLTDQITQKEDQEKNEIRQEYENVQLELEQLITKEKEIGQQLIKQVIDLVQDSMVEVSLLNNQLVPLISLMRSELELPFNQEHFAKTLTQGQVKLEKYLSDYFNSFEDEMHLENESFSEENLP